MPSVMSARRPAALRRGPRAKPKSSARAWRGSRPAAAKRAATPGCIRPARIRFRPCATRQRLLRSRRHDVGDGAEGDQVEERVQPGLIGGSEVAALAQLRPQRQQHVEGDAAAGELLAGEAAARLARVDDDVGRGQAHLAVDDRRQVVVGDHDREPVRRGAGDAVDAGDAVVDGEQHVGRLRSSAQIDDRRRQPVAVRSAGRARRRRASPGRRREASGRAA